MPTPDKVQRELDRRYGYRPGEHPDRAKIRRILDEEPMARWLATLEITKDLEAKRATPR